MIQETEEAIQNAHLLISRLERLSADSVWAHRASGLRGALLRTLQDVEDAVRAGETVDGATSNQLEALVADGFVMLANAAREISTPDERWR